MFYFSGIKRDSIGMRVLLMLVDLDEKLNEMRAKLGTSHLFGIVLKFDSSIFTYYYLLHFV